MQRLTRAQKRKNFINSFDILLRSSITRAKSYLIYLAKKLFYIEFLSEIFYTTSNTAALLSKNSTIYVSRHLTSA